MRLIPNVRLDTSILGQLNNFTRYEAAGANRVLRTLNLGIHFWKVDLPTLAVGVLTLVLIVVLTRTRLQALGLVVAVIVGSGVAAVFSHLNHQIATVGDVTTLPNGLPMITAPMFREIPGLLVLPLHSRSSAWCKAPVCRPLSPIQMEAPRAHHATSSLRVRAASCPGCSKGCRPAARCRPLRLRCKQAPVHASRSSSPGA